MSKLLIVTDMKGINLVRYIAAEGELTRKLMSIIERLRN